MPTCIDHEFEERVCKVEMPLFPFVKLNFRYMGANRQTDRHTHASRNAVTLVWGSLRLAPITMATSYDFMHIATKVHEVTWLEYEICTVQAKKLTCTFLITSRKVDHFLL